MQTNTQRTFGRRHLSAQAEKSFPAYADSNLNAETNPIFSKPTPENVLAFAPIATNASVKALAGNAALLAIKNKIHDQLLSDIDYKSVSIMPQAEIRSQVTDLIGDIITRQRLVLTKNEEQLIAAQILDDMLGWGPLQTLLLDETVTDIMVNGPTQVFAERHGKLELTDITFRDNEHVTQIARRIVSQAGRRIDESNPMCDARLPDGSRVHAAIPPSVLKGTTICIRKFPNRKITLDHMVESGNISQGMCDFLAVCARMRLNVIISGGTGSGKTTLLNAISKQIGKDERIITIEDTAELQLQQAHVVGMETRDANIEGDGEIKIRDLLRNSLRMRPDRIIVGEVRGGEAFDLLQAMNTGHEGSMGTLHANSPRDALMRLENMISMAGVGLSPESIRAQIASAVHLIVHVKRMRDGKRRVTHITEVTGMEGNVILTHDLFTFEHTEQSGEQQVTGNFRAGGSLPSFAKHACEYNLRHKLLDIFPCTVA